jgi:hypothetical protein
VLCVRYVCKESAFRACYHIRLWKSNREGFKLRIKHLGTFFKPETAIRVPIASTLDDRGILAKTVDLLRYTVPSPPKAGGGELVVNG